MSHTILLNISALVKVDDAFQFLYGFQPDSSGAQDYRALAALVVDQESRA